MTVDALRCPDGTMEVVPTVGWTSAMLAALHHPDTSLLGLSRECFFFFF